MNRLLEDPNPPPAAEGAETQKPGSDLNTSQPEDPPHVTNSSSRDHSTGNFAFKGVLINTTMKTLSDTDPLASPFTSVESIWTCNFQVM